MKAPDKIYIEQKAVMYDMVNTEPCKPDDYEYIHKDVLLEIIEAARESAITQKNFNNCLVEQEARIDAYDYIKHKIESL